MIDVLIVFGFLSFSILILITIMAIAFIIGALVIFGPQHIKQEIRLFLRSDKTFMYWLYGEEYAEKMPVKVYSEGWREGDYK